MSVSREFTRFLCKQSRRFRQNLQRACDTGDVDAVHDLRVASRRAAEPLRVVTAAPALKKTLRRARQAFRTVRDLDVLQSALCEPDSPSRLEGIDLARLEVELEDRRKRELDLARRCCRKLDLRRFAGDLSDVARRLHKGRGSQDRMLRQSLQELQRKRLARLLEHDPERSGSDLHATRIALKGFRYTTELLYAVDRREDDALTSTLKTMQELLGHWNDQVNAAQCIARIATRRQHLAPDPTGSARLLEFAASCARSADETARRLRESWASLITAVEASMRCADQAPAESKASAETAPESMVYESR